MIAPPVFWSSPNGRWHPVALLLRPLSWIYGAVVAWKLKAQPAKVDIPVICIGNVTLGGVGKTPFAHALAETLTEMGHTPHILLRGYGGKAMGPLRVNDRHSCHDVGDEALLHARHWPTWVARDRVAGARLAQENGATCIIMDDGFQNPSLHKDHTYLLIDGKTGLGNGLVFPSGPLRESPKAAFNRAQTIVMVGESKDGFPGTLPRLPELNMILESDVSALDLKKDYVAFAGIGRPEKFFDSLKAQGLNIIEARQFADHHPYTDADVNELVTLAALRQARLLTTEKDYVRLTPEQQQHVQPVGVNLTVLGYGALSDSLPDIFKKPKQHD